MHSSYWVSYPVVSNTARIHYYEVAKPSPTFSGHPSLLALGAVIRNERLAQGLSPETLAYLAKIDRSYMGGIERREHNITVMNLLKVADALNVKVTKFFDTCEL